MKKKKLNLKLQLNKETIAKLNKNEMNEINGGTGGPLTEGCTAGCCTIGCCGNRATYQSVNMTDTCCQSQTC